MDQSEKLFRVATFNIRNTQDRYEERKSYLKSTLQSVKAQFMGLQEVAFGENGQLDELISDGDTQLYDAYLAETQLKFQEIAQVDKEQRIDGNAIIVDKSFGCQIEFHKLLHLSHVRVAQKMLVNISGDKILLVNTHLHHTIPDGLIRFHQSEGILSWVKGEADKYPILIFGDFNFTPNSKEYQLFESAGYQSCYKMLNKAEPERTFPTGLTGPCMDIDDPGTFDYIWFRSIGNKFEPKNVNVFGTQQLPNCEGIYASDHYGLICEFIIK